MGIRKRRSGVVLGAWALVAMFGSASAQTDGKPEPSPEGTVDVAIDLTGPTSLVAGQSAQFSLTVRNDGPQTASSVRATLSLADGFAYLSHLPSDAGCTFSGFAYATPDRPSGGGSMPGGGGYLDCAVGPLAPGASQTVTIELERTRAYALYLSGWAYADEGDVNYEDNYFDLYLEEDASRPADLSVILSKPTAWIGQEFTLTATVANAGPADGAGVEVFFWMPYGVEPVAMPDSCVRPDGESAPGIWMPNAITCAIASVGSGEQTDVSLVLRRTSGWELWGGASVAGLNLDRDLSDDYSDWYLPADPSATSDISLSSAIDVQPLVGDRYTITYLVRNRGPALAGDVTLQNYAGDGAAFLSATEGCSFQEYDYTEPKPVTEDGSSSPDGPVYFGGGYLTCDVGTLEPQETREIAASFERTSPYPLYDYASVWTSNYDPQYENNYAEVFIEADRSKAADVALKVSAPSEVQPGSNFTFTLQVENLGAQPAEGVTVYDHIGEGLAFVSADEGCTFSPSDEPPPPTPEGSSPTYSYGNELVCRAGNLQVGEMRSFDVEVTRTSDWWIWNGAWITSDTFDPDYSNDYAYFELAGDDPYADCSAIEGTATPDQITTDACPVKSGGGTDQVAIEVGTSAQDRIIRTGRGSDSINVDVRTGSSARRVIEVRSGKGDDVIDVIVGAVAGDALIKLYGGDGSDQVTLDIAPGAINVRLVVELGAGDDVIRYIRYGDRSTPPLKTWGGPGRDRIIGGQGNDSLRGGDGRDRIDAGAGDDSIIGGRGRDVCIDGPGDDSVSC